MEIWFCSCFRTEINELFSLLFFFIFSSLFFTLKANKLIFCTSYSFCTFKPHVCPSFFSKYTLAHTVSYIQLRYSYIGKGTFCKENSKVLFFFSSFFGTFWYFFIEYVTLFRKYFRNCIAVKGENWEKGVIFGLSSRLSQGCSVMFHWK